MPTFDLDDSGDISQLPGRLCALVEEELDMGETITWVGQPIGRKLALKALPMVLFGIPWTAFAVFWMVMALSMKPPNFNQLQVEDLFPLFGIPFVLIGFGLLSSPFWMMRKAKRTAYVITDRRALIFDSGWSTTIQSFSADRLNNLKRTQHADGSGDLVFERILPYGRQNGPGFNEADFSQFLGVGFHAIPHVKRVEELIRRIPGSAPKREM